MARSRKPRTGTGSGSSTQDAAQDQARPETGTEAGTEGSGQDTPRATDSGESETLAGATSGDSLPAAGSDDTLAGAAEGDTLSGAADGSDTVAVTPEDEARPASEVDATPEADTVASSIPASGPTSSVEATPEADHRATTEAEAEPTARDAETPRDTTPAYSPAPEARMKSGPGFLTLLLGGVIAGAIGFFLAQAGLFGGAPAEDPVPALSSRLDKVESTLAGQSGRMDELNQRLDDQAGRLETQASELEALRADVDGLAPAEGGVPQAAIDELKAAADQGVSDLSGRLDQLQQTVSALSAKVDELGQAPQADTGALDAYKQQLDQMQATLDSQRQEIEATRASAAEIQQQAQAQAEAITARAALNRIQAAVEGGGGYSAALDDLESNTKVAVPDALSAHAENGVPTLAELQRSFPPAARAGLDAAERANAADAGLGDRALSFLRTQVGARSLEEREGSSPDAILSRAEARLSDGEVQAALDEIAKLPEPGQEAMADWTARAQARVEAQSAASELASALNSN